jgi:hypothetical protein
MEMIINLIIQLVSGAIGGHTAGATNSMALGNTGNTIAGAISGVGGGELLPLVGPALSVAAAGGGFDFGALIGQVVGGGVGGAILTAIVGLIKNQMAGSKT